MLPLAVLAACADAGRKGTGECRAVALQSVIDGGADGFHQLDAVTLGPDGRVFAVDAGDHRLIAFDPAGREIWRRGRDGSGPGELRNPSGLAYRDGGLVTRDVGNHRLSFWTADGEPAGTVSLAEFAFPGHPGWAAALPDGRVVAMAMPPMRLGNAQPMPGAVVVGERGAPRVDTVATFLFPAAQMVRAGGAQLPVMPPFAPYPQVAAAADGTLYVSRDGDYVVERYDAAGRKTGVLRGPPARPPLTEDDRSEAARRLPPGDAAALRYPESLPAVAGLAEGGDGELLVKTGWRAGDRVRWDRWSHSGEYAGSIMIPRALRSVSVRGDRMAAIQADSLGVQSIGLFRIGGRAECAGPLPGE